MARHRSPCDSRRHSAPTHSLARAGSGAQAGFGIRAGSGAHRLPRPDPATRGRAFTAAVAAGALVVAGHSLQASAAGTEVTGGVSRMALTGSSPAPEIVRVDTIDPAIDVQALSRAVERVDRAAAEAAAEAVARAAYEKAMRNRLGKPYTAGNNHSLDGWIAKALGLMGLPQALSPGVKKIIMHESTGNPNAINNWDSNALRGTPSQGLMQTIPSTFRACVLPSLRDRAITDPVANITAGVRSMITHHGIKPLINGGRRDSSGNYLGYGGAGCSSYNIAKYEEQLRDLWDDEPLPQS